ncbi:MAG: DUF4382 domain-containing protein [Cyclobacteriaceae bacterium]|nr:DUF4382 domain-containing protein [Cyclobacteriaceae bacterium]
MKTLLALFNFLLLVGLLASCNENDAPNSSEARVNFRLVDAPADYDEVWIEILALRVKVDYEGSDMEDDDDTWEEIIYDGPQMVNLLDLTGGNSLLIGSEDFPEGEIDQIRLILGENNYLMKGEQKIELKTPSAQQSGLKIKVEEEIQGGQTYDLIIDFDAAKSIVTAGNSGNVILKPVLRAYVEVSQGISGQVFPLEAQPVQVTITGNGMEINTFADETGKYSVMGLTPGTYTISFTPNEAYLPQSLNNIIVEEGKVTTPNVVNLEPAP